MSTKQLFLGTILALSFLFNQAKAQQTPTLTEQEKIIFKGFQVDQDLRKNLTKLLNDPAAPKDSIKFFAIELRKNDLINQQAIFPILERYKNKEISLSDSALNASYYIIQHAELADQLKYDRFVEELFQKQAIDKNEYAMFKDRLLVKQGKAQIYLKQAYMNAETRDVYPYPLQHNARELAKEKGLLTELENELKNYENEYRPAFLKPEEVLILGFITEKSPNGANPVEKVSISMNGKEITQSNDKGFFTFVVNRKALGKDIHLKYAETQRTLPMEVLPTEDWKVINVNWVKE